MSAFIEYGIQQLPDGEPESLHHCWAAKLLDRPLALSLQPRGPQVSKISSPFLSAHVRTCLQPLGSVQPKSQVLQQAL